MGTIIASTIIDRTAILLQDVSNIRWPRAELLGWLNDGQRAVVLLKPNAYTINTTIQLAAGTKQTLPASGVSLIDVVRNMGINGTTAGRAVRITMREIMDSQSPDWHSSTPNAEVKHYMYSLMDQKTFYVWPPQPTLSRGYVELNYTASPPDAAENAAITIDDIYQSVLIDYMMYRAYSKDVEFAVDTAQAKTHQDAYITALTGKARGEVATNPNANAPANPNVTPTR